MNWPCWWITSGRKSSSSLPRRRRSVGRVANEMSKDTASLLSGSMNAGNRTIRMPSRRSSRGASW